MTRYTPSRMYLAAGLTAWAFGALSVWFAFRWIPSAVPSLLLLVSGACLIFLAFRPAIEIHPRHLRIGDRVISWDQVAAVDRTGWISPLVVFLTMEDQSRVVLVYPGDLEKAKALLRHLQRCARGAMIDGIPYAEFWGEGDSEDGPGESAQKPPAGPRYRLLRDEDEAEVERLYQRLKAVGHLDNKSGDETNA